MPEDDSGPCKSSSGASFGRFELIDRTAAQSRLTITGIGFVGIGTTSPDDRLNVAGDIRVGTGASGCVKDANGTVIAGACSSDARLKKEITPFPRLLDRLVQLQPVHFYWRTDQFPNKRFGSSQSSFGGIGKASERDLMTATSRYSFFGRGAGHNNVEGDRNSFFGFGAGFNNTATGNSFFGTNAGLSNNTGSGNSFFGDSAGGANTIGAFNSFFGFQSGLFTTAGSNVFFGYQAALNNTTGKRNVIIGTFADFRDTPATSSGAVAGDENTFLGYQAGGAAARRNAAAIGRNAFVGCDDCMVLGATGVKVGIGMTTPQQNLSVNGGLVIDQANLNDGTFPGGTNKALTFGNGSGEAIASKRTAGGNQFGLDFYTNFLKRMTITNGGDVGIGTTDPLARLHVIGETHLSGKLVLGDFGTATATHLCLSGLSEISFCSSSLRYKTNVLPLNSGLESIRRLRPVTFDWKTTGQRDLGLIAEEVDTVEPLLVTRDKTGQIQGVKYDQLNVLLINAINEQQSQIKQQQSRVEIQQAQIDKQLGQIEKQQRQIESLLNLVCLDHPDAPACKNKNN